MTRALVALSLAACGSHDRTPGPASASSTATATATATTTGPATATATTTGTGSLTVHVTWPSAPAAARASGPRNPCGVPRRPLASISTLHGVASAVVIVTDVPAPTAKTPPPVELVLRDCRLDPLVTLAPATAAIHIASVDLRRHRVEVASSPADLAHAAASAPLGAIDLAWAGDEVSLATLTAAPAVLRLAPDTAADDVSWVVIPASLTALTDPGGAVTFPSLPTGKHHVVAWLPTQLAQIDVDVLAGKDNDVTLSFP